MRICSERHNSLYSEIGIAILGSAEEDGCDEAGVTGVTGGALVMVGEAIGTPSDMCRGDALLAAGCGRPGWSTQ